MAEVGKEEGWEIASSRKGKSQVQAAVGRGKYAVSSFQERSGFGSVNTKGRGVPSCNSTLNARRGPGLNPTSSWGVSNVWDQRRAQQRTSNNDHLSTQRSYNFNSTCQSTQESYAPRTVAVVPPPLFNGWQWSNKNDSLSSSNNSSCRGVGETAGGDNKKPSSVGNPQSTLLPFERSGEPSRRSNEMDDQESEAECEVDHLESDEEYTSSDGFDSDSSNVSHETMKKNKWFKDFFESLDALTLEEVNDTERQWHCPACKGGVGAIDWYRGMQPVLSHAKTIRTKRVKLHRKLAEILEEELKRRGAGCVITEEMFGQWKGLKETVSDHEIVWPPMVVIQNTLLDQDGNEKWTGMGNKELLEYFKDFKASKARHAYGPRGHRGMSVLIFEDSAVGFMEAERLHKQFLKEGRGRGDWEKHPVLFHPGRKRILYGYFATKQDMEIFNQHSKGKSRLKYDMRSYNDMVVKPMRQMEADNQKLNWLETKVAKQQDYSKTMAENFGRMRSKLRLRDAEIKIIRQRATDQHEEYKKEMDDLEQTYREQIGKLNDHIARRELEMEKMQDEFKRANIDRCDELEASNTPEDRELRNDDQNEKQNKIDKEIERRKAIVETSFNDSEEFERERQDLIQLHDERRKAMKLKHWEEEVKLEKELEKEREDLVEKYLKKGKDAGYVIV